MSDTTAGPSAHPTASEVQSGWQHSLNTNPMIVGPWLIHSTAFEKLPPPSPLSRLLLHLPYQEGTQVAESFVPTPLPVNTGVMNPTLTLVKFSKLVRRLVQRLLRVLCLAAAGDSLERDCGLWKALARSE